MNEYAQFDYEYCHMCNRKMLVPKDKTYLAICDDCMSDYEQYLMAFSQQPKQQKPFTKKEMRQYYSYLKH